MRRPCGHYYWRAGITSPSESTAPDPDPGYVPPVVGPPPWEPQPATLDQTQGDDYLVAVYEHPSHRQRGVLWDARIDSMAIRAQDMGGNELTFSCPATPEAMRIWGDPIAGEVGENGGPIHHLDNSVSRMVGIGSAIEQKVRWYFFVRGKAEIVGGRLVVSCRGVIGGLTGDRVVGPPTRRNLIGSNGGFELGNLTRWRTVGDATAGVEAGGVDGEWCAWVKGTPDGTNYLEAKMVLATLEGAPYGLGGHAGVAWVKLPPIGAEIDGSRLVTVGVVDQTGRVVWPPPDGADPEAGAVSSDMRRGEWLEDQVVAVGYTEQPPFRATLLLRLHPTDPVQKTYFDGAALLAGEVTGTGYVLDHLWHVRVLLMDAQRGRGKTSWGVGVMFGEESGVDSMGVWPHEDAIPLYEALESVTDVEYWDEPKPGGGPGVKVAKRRGSIRTDVAIREHDIIGKLDFTVDPGGQRTAARGQSAAGSIWGGADVGVFDTAAANGQVIDVVIQGPSGMPPVRLTAYTRAKLDMHKVLPGSTTLMLRWELGMRLTVGDTVHVAIPGGEGAAHIDWMRINQWVPDLVDQQWVVVDLSTDVEMGRH